MKRYILTFFVLVQALAMRAQEEAVAGFVPPFDFPIVFSGNFGELRANHFHGGLDFKTQGGIGRKVRALADGYISGIRVTHGSGYVLDVTYHNGYSTTNRHLEAFVGDIARRVKALQYAEERWEVSITPAPDEYPVKAGEVIALSGNTGYSFGPHLHLDMYERATGDHIDPLPFYIDKVKDTTAPRAMALMLFPQPGEGVVNGKTANQRFDLRPKQPVTAWGTIGVGIRAYDYMDGVHNRYGVKTVILEVDSVEVFRSEVDRFSPAENRYINAWAYRGQYMKSFREPGCHLRLLHPANDNRGLITIDEERPYRLVYTLKDALGNTSRVRFTIQGKPADIPTDETRPKYLLHWDRTNYLQEPGLELLLPRGTLYNDARLSPAITADSGDIAFTYRLHTERIPLHTACDLRIRLRHTPLADSTKYYVARVNAQGRKSSVGGRYKEGVMHARISELGTYTVAIDTVSPTVKPVNQQQWGKTGRIVLKPADKQTGIASYRGTIDGQYALFGKPNSVQGNLVCRLDAERVRKGRRHTVEMTVRDGVGNETTERFEFYW